MTGAAPPHQPRRQRLPSSFPSTFHATTCAIRLSKHARRHSAISSRFSAGRAVPGGRPRPSSSRPFGGHTFQIDRGNAQATETCGPAQYSGVQLEGRILSRWPPRARSSRPPMEQKTRLAMAPLLKRWISSTNNKVPCRFAADCRSIQGLWRSSGHAARISRLDLDKMPGLSFIRKQRAIVVCRARRPPEITIQRPRSKHSRVNGAFRAQHLRLADHLGHIFVPQTCRQWGGAPLSQQARQSRIDRHRARTRNCSEQSCRLSLYDHRHLTASCHLVAHVRRRCDRCGHCTADHRHLSQADAAP